MYGFSHRVPWLASMHEHMMPKHSLIGCQKWHDWSSNMWSLADCDKNFRTWSSAHKMAERLDIEDFFGELDPDLCQYAYTFHESGFTSSITMKYWQEQNFQRLSECESSCYGLLNFKCLMTDHARFETQLEHVSASRVHA